MIEINIPEKNLNLDKHPRGQVVTTSQRIVLGLLEIISQPAILVSINIPKIIDRFNWDIDGIPESGFD